MGEHMYLVPEDLIDAWRTDKRSSLVDHPLQTAALKADELVVNTLKNSEYSDPEKAVLHGQYLGAYLNAHDKFKSPSAGPPPPPPPFAPGAGKKPPVTMDGIPRAYRRQAEALLRTWHADPYIEWNDRLELSLNGQPLPGSNVVDLVAHAVSKSKKSLTEQPPGFQSMRNVLKERNTPKTLINNPRWLDSDDQDSSDNPMRSRTPWKTQRSSFFADDGAYAWVNITSSIISNVKPLHLLLTSLIVLFFLLLAMFLLVKLFYSPRAYHDQ